MMRGPIMISTPGSAYFAEGIARQLPARIMGVERKTFSGGEHYRRLLTDDRLAFLGRDVILVASTVTDDDLNELYRIASAVAKYGARRLIFVIPFFGYSTMERAVKPGEIVTAKVIARQLSQLPQGDLRSCFLMLDLHVSGMVHYFEGECLRSELYAEGLLMEGIRDLGLPDFMFGTADLGRPAWVETFAKTFKTSLALVRKTRSFETTEVQNVIGDVAGRNVIINDDMVRSGGTLIDAAEAYLEKGAQAVYAVLSHFAANDAATIQRLGKSCITRFVTTNSHPMSQHQFVRNSGKFIVKDASPVFAEALLRLTASPA